MNLNPSSLIPEPRTVTSPETGLGFTWFPRALPTETKVESGTSQSKNGTVINLGNSGEPEKLDGRRGHLLKGDAGVAEISYGLGFRVQGLGLVKSLGLWLVQRVGSQGLGFKI